MNEEYVFDQKQLCQHKSRPTVLEFYMGLESRELGLGFVEGFTNRVEATPRPKPNRTAEGVAQLSILFPSVPKPKPLF